MDVDLLKPGTVPISPDTVLGFEFLLDKELLLKHLQKPNSDPSPTDLITKFNHAIATTLRNKVEVDNIEAATTDSGSGAKLNHPAKNIAMKILSLKVAAYLNWNLGQIRSLPFKTQISLLQDLMYFTSEEKTVMEISNIEQPDTKSATPQFLFALLLFYRWLLSTSMHRVTSNWQQRYGLNEMSLTDENIICCPDNIKKTVSFLTDALQWQEIPFMLTFECFKMPTEENGSIEFEWSKGKPISRDEFCAQICYDLGTFFFYQEDYQAAKQHFFKCQTYHNVLPKQDGFVVFDRKTLDVYISACDPSADLQKKTLLEQLNNSIVNQFMGITGILQQDNLQKEIPLAHRINLELNIQGALSSGVFTVARDLLYKVKALNYVRCILDRKFLNEFSLTLGKNVEAFLWAIQVNWKMHEDQDKKVIKDYLLELVIKEEIADLLERIQSNDILGNIFDKAELQFLSKKDKVVNVSEHLFKSESSFTDTMKKIFGIILYCGTKEYFETKPIYYALFSGRPRMELRQISKQLISSYDWKEIRDLLTKIGMMNLGTVIWELNPQWELPIPLQSVIKGLPREEFTSYKMHVLLTKLQDMQGWCEDIAVQDAASLVPAAYQALTTYRFFIFHVKGDSMNIPDYTSSLEDAKTEVPHQIHVRKRARLSKRLLHDVSYVLLAKSREQLLNKNWNLALELIIVLDKELQVATCNVCKLSKMINWEVLLVQITQLMEEWPRSSIDKAALANACEVCLQTNDSVLPRTEIVECCAICLLNLGRWEFLISYEKRWTTFEIMSAIALACHEMVKSKGVKKFSKNLWEIVLPVFAPNPSMSKRSNAGYHDSNGVKSNLLSIFSRLKESYCLTVVISMLTKLYNIFKDETNLELQVDYMNLWPAAVSNANSYNVSACSEILSEVLTQALKEYPSNIPWLRLMGDVNFANTNYKIALSFYLKSLIICNDYFNIPVRYDDHVFRRMIKCCQALGCYTQAAVLCQFLEEPDYALAFRILGEQKLCNDAVDAYYHCFWDTNILEFLIHTHNKRGEFQRRKCATQVIGMLEINSNNNEEIQREASNLRKSVFLRALCKQYVF